MTYIRASVAKWKIEADSTEGKAIVHQVQTEGVALLRRQPGFIQYRSGYVDSRTTINIYEWESEEECQTGIHTFVAWLQSNGIMNQAEVTEVYNADALIGS